LIHNYFNSEPALVFLWEKLHILSRFSFFFTHRGGVILGHFWPKITPLHPFSLSFNQISDFHISDFSFFVISSSEYDVVLFVVLCGIVWFHVLLRCSFVPIERSTSVNQLQIQSMIWTSTLQIRKHEYSGDLDLIILFVGILPLYAINLDALSMFAVSSFMFLAILMMLLYLMYSIDLNEWKSFWFCKKNILF